MYIQACFFFLFFFVFTYNLFIKNHVVGNSTNTLNFNFNQITVIEVTRFLHTHSNTSGSTSHNDSTLFQSSTLRNERNDFRNMKQEIRSVCSLSDFTIYSSFKIKTRTITQNLVGDNDRTDRSKLVEAFTETPLRNTTSVLGIFLP